MLLQLLLTLSVVYSQWWPQWGPWKACNPKPPCDDCPCDYGHCHWWGDPHTNTFDNFWHHFQGLPYTDYRYVSPCTSDFNLVPFQILTRHKPCGWWGLTCSDYVDIRLYDPSGTPGSNYLATVRIDNGLTVRYTTSIINLANGVHHVPLGGGVYFVITRYSYYVEVAVYTGLLCPWPDNTFSNLRPDFIVRANSWMGRVDVQLNEYYKGLVCGLCGFWSGTQDDEFTINGYYTAVSNPPPAYLQCSHYDSTITQSMWSYTASDWWHVNSWGQFWVDRGLYVRRLQGGGENEEEALQINVPTLPDSTCPDLAIEACQSRFPDQQATDPTFCDECADEACGRLGTDCHTIDECLLFCTDGCSFGDTNCQGNDEDPCNSLQCSNADGSETVRGAQ